MPGCAADYCTNSSQKGFRMCYFPTDMNRRNMWIKNVNRKDWIPTRNSSLCEVHFEPVMWEKVRVDGKKKLRNNAIPTLFGQNIKNNQMKNNKVQDAHFTDNFLLNEPTDKEQINSDETIRNEIQEASDKEQINSDKTIRNEMQDLQDENNLQDTKVNYKEHLQKLEKLYLKSERLRKQMKIELRAARKKIKKLENEIGLFKSSTAINKILNNDQIKLLNNEYKKLPQWSNASLLKAFKLKLICGTHGYQELIKENLPLPSLRTLNRKLKDFKFKPGICNEISANQWKQVVDFMNLRGAVCLEGEVSKTTGESLKQIVLQKQSEEVGLLAHGITSDMDSSNL